MVKCELCRSSLRIKGTRLNTMALLASNDLVVQFKVKDRDPCSCSLSAALSQAQRIAGRSVNCKGVVGVRTSGYPAVERNIVLVSLNTQAAIAYSTVEGVVTAAAAVTLSSRPNQLLYPEAPINPF